MTPKLGPNTESMYEGKNEVLMCRNSDIAIPTLFHYFLQHPFLYTLVIFMKFLPLVVIMIKFNNETIWAVFIYRESRNLVIKLFLTKDRLLTTKETLSYTVNDFFLWAVYNIH